MTQDFAKKMGIMIQLAQKIARERGILIRYSDTMDGAISGDGNFVLTELIQFSSICS